MPKRDPHIDAHLEWIGFVRPTGLVVSAPALVRAGAILPRDPEGQRLLRACVAERRFHPAREPEPWLPDFRAFASSVLGWNFSPKGYAGTDDSPIPPELETPLLRGESSGWLDLHVADMVTTTGRPIVATLRLLLNQARLLSLPRDKRFAALLAESRRFQNDVSERLAEQVLHALYELLRGVQAVDDTSHRELLREPLAERPDDVHHALLTVILRLVFLLYAEERDLLPEGETFARHYSLAGLTSACARTRLFTPTR